MGNRMTISRAQRLYKLPADPLALAMRPMEPADLDGVLSLLNTHLQSYQVHPIFSRDEVAHNFLPKGDNIYTYVKTDQSMFHRHTVNFALGGAVTDMLSFYRLESSVINNPKVSTVKAAYSFYNIATTVPFKQLMEKALHLASAEGFDVFNALNLMDNGPILEVSPRRGRPHALQDLKFDEGHGNLHYYLYNWRIPSVGPTPLSTVIRLQLNPSDIGLVLF
ncbi:myristoyl-CoA:protein N-myristoyltransferase domain protein [Babesia caballi]|uniref:Glycylpeptide N-tetradecanoyltransferase n=1 Tax=Babesia caballi TaxID=5871 RepID=A0AAV4LUC4_BABCB|nr:myristoyl-CoA:protein N-myristoyltransferase domain protein [Babesia caballi]